MKIAIVHDYIKEYGGAERVLEELLKIYPKADIYTALYHPFSLGPHRSRFEKHEIHQSFFQYIPFAHKLISLLRLLSPFAFASFDLSSYDVVIVSQTGAYFPNFVKTKFGKDSRLKIQDSRNKTKKKTGALHICYTHTPPRYLYGYMTARAWKKNAVVRVVAEAVNHFLRIVDYHASTRVDQFIANSEEVAARIQKFYRRKAVVIYPPAVEISNIKRKMSKVQTANQKVRDSSSATQNDKGYFLAGGRLARAKGMDVIVDAFVANKKPLKIFGKGFAGYEEDLRSKIEDARGENIELVGEVSDEEKLELMRNAEAYIFASYDEDFGITPVEAMGQGTPVVAYRSGGVKETVVDGKTGAFYSPNNAEELNNAIRKLEALRQTQGDKINKACLSQAEKFSDGRFREEIKKYISSF